MKPWTSMIAAGTALALLPQTGSAQETDRQCNMVPNASGIELLISVEGIPGRYALTCRNGALVAVPAEAAGLVSAPTPQAQATRSAARTVDALISGTTPPETEIGRNMAGITSQGDTPARGETAPASADSQGSGEPTAPSDAAPQDPVAGDIPAVATVDRSTGTTDEPPVVSAPPPSVTTKSGPGSMDAQKAAAAAVSDRANAPAGAGAPATGTSDAANTPEKPDAATEGPRTPGAATGAAEPRPSGAPLETGPGALAEQMAAATSGAPASGSAPAPSKTGPGSLDEQKASASRAARQDAPNGAAVRPPSDTASSARNDDAGASTTPDATPEPDKTAVAAPKADAVPDLRVTPGGTKAAGDEEEADMIAVPANVIASAKLALPGVTFSSVSMREVEDGQLFALRGQTETGTPVAIAVEPEGRIVSVDRPIDPAQVPDMVDRIARALLPDRSVEDVLLSTRDNYSSYFIFRGVDDQAVPFALEVRSDGQESRFVTPN
ncbi:hypothetical protein U0C82_11130 [Fulvimarina sp. 2208YS6-2-32]|uniref:PepSY domain-containing protein n=1 Tax=Fulvimarina uroteuthidis TaxID=3098149 RepID=A0ABU5I3N2_9HYPH|nr:hypothetical protein [Fulvimarina sp. 2208YS6-2-32]MDY8109690.1 hypothetical protein [Fulvimarina sp. 2208YS6-2-32]